MFKKLTKRGQSTLEYAIIIAVIVAALIAMQAYFKRGLQGRFKQSADDIGEQFSPTQSTIKYKITRGSTQKETVTAGISHTDISRGEQDRTGSDNITALDKEPK